MKSGTFIIYTLTILAVFFDLLLINIFLNQDRFNFLIKLGFFKAYDQQAITSFAVFILIVSGITCALLIISFILLIKKLLTPFDTKFRK